MRRISFGMLYASLKLWASTSLSIWASIFTADSRSSCKRWSFSAILRSATGKARRSSTALRMPARRVRNSFSTVSLPNRSSNLVAISSAKSEELWSFSVPLALRSPPSLASVTLPTLSAAFRSSVSLPSRASRLASISRRALSQTVSPSRRPLPSLYYLVVCIIWCGNW